MGTVDMINRNRAGSDEVRIRKLMDKIKPKEVPWAKNYTPQVNDPVVAKGHMGQLVVVRIDAEKQTADVKPVAGDDALTRDVPWESLSYAS
jgi:hypothetical protein